MKRVLLFTVLATVALESLSRLVLALLGREGATPCPDMWRGIAEILPYLGL